MAKTTRRRSIGEQVVRGSIVETLRNANGSINSGPTTTVGSPLTKVAGAQVTVSEGHPFRNNPKVGKEDIGGDFFTQKYFWNDFQSQDWQCKYKNNDGRTLTVDFHGPILAINPSITGLPPISISSNNQLDGYGTTAIARTSPTNPVSNLTTSLAELFREGLPQLVGAESWRQGAMTARNAGSEYLNVQFGWRPLINDISKFGKGVVDSDALVQKYLRGVGKPTRRGWDFPVQESVVETQLATNAVPFTGNVATSNWYDSTQGYKLGVRTRRRETYVRRYFRGAYTYFVPASVWAEATNKYVILARQLGIEITPELLWNVSPWSWAADWFGNFGDVVTNFTNFNQRGLVLTYGYIMEHVRVTDTYTLTGWVPSGTVKPSVQDVVVTYETKQRRAATPYGFGLQFEGFSNFQKSILVALGLTKGAR